jgi:MoxR-like ATPase
VWVKWDTTQARKIPSQEGWMRTIVALSEAELASLLGSTPPVDEPGLSDEYAAPSLAQLIAGVEADGLKLDARTVRRFHVALQVRGFVILAGISGTGKTWLTRAYASSLKARYLLVPVAPNWTSNEDLLGYFNPLSKTYFDTAVSRFLREAAAEYRSATEAGRTPRSFHLVLDEMNLARVEHYFAKFLSALEVRQRDKVAELELFAGEVVLLTPNLSFIGTVNVDETTHGFSDKVYDRAQLLELPAPRELLAQHVAGEACGEVLLAIWDAVAPVAPFAFRVLDDVVEYVDRSVELGVDWKDALDEQVVQKVLTKLKGTDPRIATAFEGVMAVTEGQFPLSHERARRMLEGFRQHGFASFF